MDVTNVSPIKIIENINEIISKFILCVLPTQCGKTFWAILKIINEIKQDDYLGKSIHIVFTMNTLLNNEQFAKRLDTIEHEYGYGAVCIFSSRYSGGKYTHVTNVVSLQGLCANKETCPRVIVMCSNKRRYEDGVEFIKVINENNINNITRLFAYYDEIHEYINDTLRSQIEEIHEFDIVKCINGLTATPKNIFQEMGFWSKILIQSDDISYENYIGCGDMLFNCIDDYFDIPYIRPMSLWCDELDNQTIGFVEYVLEKHPEILSVNTRVFIPAHVRRIGHNRLRESLFTINNDVVVVLLNGSGNTIQYTDNYGRITIPIITRNEEVCETINRIISQKQLRNRPIVFTGFICVGMGQTLAHRLYGSFTSAILSHLYLTNDQLYQLFGRITGRMRDWDTYIQTQVYCPTIIMNRVTAMEICSRNMTSEENRGSYISEEEYLEPMKNVEGKEDILSNNRQIKKKNTPKKDARISQSSYWRVPIILSGFTGREPIFTEELKMPKRVAFVKNAIENDLSYKKLFDYISHPNVICSKTSRPEVEISNPNPKGSYKKHITDVVNASNNNRPFSVSSRHEDKNNWSLFIDSKENRLCILLWVLDSSLY